MRDRPDAGRLLEQARVTLLSDLLEALPADHRYTALMVANALAIAQRELQSGADLASEEAQALAQALPEAAGSDRRQMEAVLASQIRAGRHDASGAVHALLFESCRRRLQITNPKHLAREGFEA